MLPDWFGFRYSYRFSDSCKPVEKLISFINSTDKHKKKENNMQHLFTLTCDFCGTSIERDKDVPKGKKYILCNISFDVLSHETVSQGAERIGRFDLCNSCALNFFTYLKCHCIDKNNLSNVIKNFHPVDEEDNFSFYRKNDIDSDGRGKVYCSLANYKNEPGFLPITEMD